LSKIETGYRLLATGYRPLTAALVLLMCAACRQDMHDQPKYTAYKPSDFFADQRSARPVVEGTIAQGHLNEDELLHTGRVGGQPATVFPFAIDETVMRRGRARYDIFCSPCHGLTGEGDGMVVQRGYRRPPSFHADRLRQAPPGHLYDVITNGFGAMPDYAAQIPVRDRWAITAYMRALQLSQYATVAQLSPEAQGRLK
jgi:mono/diheme cytochrome c family protein